MTRLSFLPEIHPHTETHHSPATERAVRSGCLLTRSAAADVLSVSVSTLERWERRQYGPEPVRLGRAIRYRSDDVVEFVRTIGRESA